MQTNAVALENVTKKFGNETIFSDLNISFGEKGLYVITGPSGCGKTTLLRIIAGLDTDYVGDVSGAGIGKCSVSFQEHRLFPAISAFKNVYTVTSGTDGERTKASMDALLSVGFEPEDFEKLPHELSGGMKQRVSLARAIAADKPVILLDEPTKELDAALREKLYDVFLKLSQKKLVIIVTHQSDDLKKFSDNVIEFPKIS